jgi:hypothetical protein
VAAKLLIQSVHGRSIPNATALGCVIACPPSSQCNCASQIASARRCGRRSRKRLGRRRQLLIEGALEVAQFDEQAALLGVIRRPPASLLGDFAETPDHVVDCGDFSELSTPGRLMPLARCTTSAPHRTGLYWAFSAECEHPRSRASPPKLGALAHSEGGRPSGPEASRLLARGHQRGHHLIGATGLAPERCNLCAWTPRRSCDRRRSRMLERSRGRRMTVGASLPRTAA